MSRTKSLATLFIAFSINTVLFQNCESRASSGSGAQVHDISQLSSDLDQAKEKWAKAKGENGSYSLKYSPTGYVMMAGRDFDVKVVDNTVASVDLAPMLEGDFLMDGEQDPALKENYGDITVEQLFSDIEMILDDIERGEFDRDCQGDLQLITRYHPEMGYPTSFYFYCTEGTGFQVSDLKFK